MSDPSSLSRVFPLAKCIMHLMEKLHSKNHPGLKSAIDDFVPKHMAWSEICANCGDQDKSKLKICSRCKAFSYCSKECQVNHWKAGHKRDCKCHWIEEFLPNIRNPGALDFQLDSTGCRVSERNKKEQIGVEKT